MYLECKLTTEELRRCSKSLAESIQRRVEVEARMEAFRTQVKADMAEIDAIIGKMTSMVNTEKEFRDVHVETTYDFKRGIKTTVRKDTGEVAKTEAIKEEERQGELV